MLLIFVKIAGAIFGLTFGFGLACAVSEVIAGKYRKKYFNLGYDNAVRDITRYGCYYGVDGEKYEIEKERATSQ